MITRDLGLGVAKLTNPRAILTSHQRSYSRELAELEAQKKAGVLYPLQKKQKEFSDTFVKYRLYGGAKGGGK